MSRLLALALYSCCAVFVTPRLRRSAPPVAKQDPMSDLWCNALHAPPAACAGLDGSAELTGVLPQGLRYETRVWLAVLKGVI